MRITRLAGLVAAGALALTAALPVAAQPTTPHGPRPHGSPDAPSVDVFVNDGKVDALSGVEFGKITDYVKVPAGTYAIKVCATADNTVCPIGPVDLTFEAGKKYTVAASDLLAQIKANVFVDGNAKNGVAKARVVHLSADTPAVDVLTQDGSAKVVENLAYPDATGYLELEAGDYDLKVCATADNSVCPLDPGALALKSGVGLQRLRGRLPAPADGAAALTAVVAVDGTATEGSRHRHRVRLLQRLDARSSRAPASWASWPPAASRRPAPRSSLLAPLLAPRAGPPTARGASMSGVRDTAPTGRATRHHLRDSVQPARQGRGGGRRDDHRQDPGPFPARAADGGRDGGVRAGQPALAGAVRAGQGLAARRRADELDDQVGRVRTRCSWSRRPARTSPTWTATSTWTSAWATRGRWRATAPTPRSARWRPSCGAASRTCCRPRTRSSPATSSGGGSGSGTGSSRSPRPTRTGS